MRALCSRMVASGWFGTSNSVPTPSTVLNKADLMNRMDVCRRGAQSKRSTGTCVVVKAYHQRLLVRLVVCQRRFCVLCKHAGLISRVLCANFDVVKAPNNIAPWRKY